MSIRRTKAITDLSDVLLNDPTDNQVLKYDASGNVWVNADTSTGGTGGISDPPNDGNSYVRESGTWRLGYTQSEVNQAIATTTQSMTLSDLQGVNALSPVSGDSLIYNGSTLNWEAKSVASNTVIVNHMNDLPSPIGDVIKLTPYTTYRISGKVDIGNNRLEVNNNAVYGGNMLTDQLISSSTGSLFNLHDTRILLNNIGIDIVNGSVINATTADINVQGNNIIEIYKIDIIRCNTIGYSEGAKGFVIEGVTRILHCAKDGLSFGGFNELLSIDKVGTFDCRGTFIDLDRSTWRSVNISTCHLNIDTSLGDKVISGASESGNLRETEGALGLYKNNVVLDANNNEARILATAKVIEGINVGDRLWYFSDNNTVPNSIIFADLIVSNPSNTPTIITNKNEWVNISGDAILSDKTQRFNLAVSGKGIVVNAPRMTTGIFSCNITATKEGVTEEVYEFAVFRNDIEQVGGVGLVSLNNRERTLTFSGSTSLNDGDILTVKVRNKDNTSDITITNMTFVMTGI